VDGELTRRAFLKRAGAFGAAAAALGAGRVGPLRAADAPAMPRIRLAGTEVSRLILDEVPFTGRGHWRYLVCKAMYQYYTDERILATLEAASASGIDTVLANTSGDGRVMGDLHERHLAEGGKVRNLLVEIISKAAAVEGIPPRVMDKAGPHVRGIFVQPGYTDGKVGGNGWDTLARWLQIIRESGAPVAVGVQRPDVLPLYEKYADKGILPVDYYVLSLCPTDRYEAEDRRRALEAVEGVSRPIVARRMMEADAPADEARAILDEVLDRLAPKDGLCVGVFPKDDPRQVRRYADQVAARARDAAPAKASDAG
jgi:hypothetical protein